MTPCKMTLEQWFKQPGASKHQPIIGHKWGQSVGIHDTFAIEHERSFLWGLSDYRVASVQAGVIWLVPKNIK